VDGPAKSESPVGNGGKHPMISLGFQRVSTILLVVQDFLHSILIRPCCLNLGENH